MILGLDGFAEVELAADDSMEIQIVGAIPAAFFGFLAVVAHAANVDPPPDPVLFGFMPDSPRAGVATPATPWAFSIAADVAAAGIAVPAASAFLSFQGHAFLLGVAMDAAGASFALVPEAAMPGTGAPPILAMLALSAHVADAGIGELHPVALLSLASDPPIPGIGTPAVFPDINLVGIAGVAGVSAPPITSWWWFEPVPPFHGGGLANGNMVAMNAITLGISEYSLAPLDLAEAGGNALLIGPDGVLRFDGGGAIDFVALLETGDLGLVPGSISTAGRAHFSLDADDALTLRAVALDAGRALSVDYPVPSRDGADQMRLVPMGRGARGSDWRFALSGPGRWSISGAWVRVERAGLGRVGAIRRR